MAEWLVQQLTALGATVEKRPIGTHKLEGKEVDLPPVVIAQVGTDPKKVSISFPYNTLLTITPYHLVTDLVS